MSENINYSTIESLPEHGEFFMKTFIRMEFALKTSGFVKQGKGGIAEPAWDDFANSEELGGTFLQAVTKIAPTMIEKPPYRHVLLVNGDMKWEEVGPIKNVKDLFLAVRRVRNNLFHGGKSEHPDEARNSVLIAESQQIIEESLKRHTDVRMNFEGRY